MIKKKQRCSVYTYFAERWNILVPPLCPEAWQNSGVDPSSLDDLLCTEEEVYVIVISRVRVL